MRSLLVIVLIGAAFTPAVAQNMTASQTNTVDSQVLGGPMFDQLVADTGKMCPGVPVARLSPAGLLGIEESYGQQLIDPAKAKFEDAERVGGSKCGDRPGASCPAVNALDEVNKAGMLPAFEKHLCAPGVVR